METSGVGHSTVNFVDADKTGFNAVDSDTFVKLLITQLQNQDPTDPMSNDEILNQVSQMRSLQASVELTDTLSALAAGQSLSSAASFLGKTVTGRSADGTVIEGVASQALVKDGKGLLRVGSVDLPLSSVTAIRESEAQ